MKNMTMLRTALGAALLFWALPACGTAGDEIDSGATAGEAALQVEADGSEHDATHEHDAVEAVTATGNVPAAEATPTLVTYHGLNCSHTKTAAAGAPAPFC